MDIQLGKTSSNGKSDTLGDIYVDELIEDVEKRNEKIIFVTMILISGGFIIPNFFQSIPNTQIQIPQIFIIPYIALLVAVEVLTWWLGEKSVENIKKYRRK